MSEPVCILPLAAALGEGPVWVPRDRALWFVDIYGRRIHRFDPATRDLRSWESPGLASFIVPAAGGGFVVGMPDGLHRFDLETGTFGPLLPVETELPDNRLNDASVGPDGSLWFGSMDDRQKEMSGAFYRLAPDGRLVTLIGDCGITNGPALSPDGRIFYHTDTMRSTIYAADVADDGTLSNRRSFAVVERADGAPDGSIVDSDGCLWVGLWGGWRARRYAPDGSILTEVRFPVANITKLALGGPDLRTAYATTARLGLDEAALADQPLAGGLFTFEADVPGQVPVDVAVELDRLPPANLI